MTRAIAKSDPVNSKKAADKFRKDSAAFAAAATKSKKKAQDTLVSLGIYTSAGKLTKKFRR